MANYLINISWHQPYPKSQDFRVEASSFSPAVSRAIKAWRKSVPKKKINQLNIKAIKI